MKQENYQWFATAEECADSAAPIFVKCKWTWSMIGVPSRNEILETLLHLATPSHSTAETGRLAVHSGRFGHQKEQNKAVLL